MLRRSFVPAAVAALLAATGLLTSGAPASAQDLTIELTPLPGSSAQATLELTAPTAAVVTATGIAGADGVVMVHVISRPNCDWEGRLALAWDLAKPSERGQGAALTEGVPLSGALVVYEDVPPGNAVAGLFSGQLSDIKSALMFEVFYDDQDVVMEPETRFLACGNADGSAVTGWEGLLDEDLRIIPEAVPGAETPAAEPEAAGAAPEAPPAAGSGGFLTSDGGTAGMWLAAAVAAAAAGIGLLGVGVRGLARRRR